MRKAADTLDSFEAAITEIYQAKAGDADWAALLAEETWLTAAESVELGLADRVAVVPDAGEAETVGEEEPEIVVVPLDDDVDDSAFLTQIAAYGRTPKPPVSSEPGNTNRKESVVSDDFKATLRERLGVTDATASEETLIAALDEALSEQTEGKAATVATLPDGAIVVDKAVHEQLVTDAAAGRKAAETLDSQRRDGIVSAALKEGRIAPASRDTWRAQLDKDEDGTKSLLESMPKNTVPVVEIGESGPEASADDALYGSIYGTPKGA
jgi:hypothetical protein